MQELGIEYEWRKLHGEYVEDKGYRAQIKRRALQSINSIITVLADFLGLPKQENISESILTKTERRLNSRLPIPLREVYLNAPVDLLDGFDNFLALDKLAFDQSQKIKFVISDQGSAEYAFTSDSSIVYEKNLKNQWVEYALLDYFIVIELFWNTMNQERLGVVLTEVPNCTRRIFGVKGKIGRFLTPVGKELTRGCPRALFCSPDRKILAMYDDEMKNAYIAAVGASPLKQLEKDSKVNLSWL